VNYGMLVRATRMKLAALTAVLVIAACGPKPRGHEPAAEGGAAASADADGVDRPTSHEAADRAHAEAAANPEDPIPSEGKHWGGWRYQGNRDDCFFVVGRRCFTDEKKACAAAKCKSGECRIDGAGPATVSCD
jgi:hypothetical protein